MNKINSFIKQTITYRITSIFLNYLRGFLETFGTVFWRLIEVFKYLFTFQINWKQVAEQSSKFAVDSHPHDGGPLRQACFPLMDRLDFGG